jgi:hypothetical protein
MLLKWLRKCRSVVLMLEWRAHLVEILVGVIYFWPVASRPASLMYAVNFDAESIDRQNYVAS